MLGKKDELVQLLLLETAKENKSDNDGADTNDDAEEDAQDRRRQDRVLLFKRSTKQRREYAEEIPTDYGSGEQLLGYRIIFEL
ncbi:hypothetical protein V1478_010313 [Vespula squamosa]|uniref:Uncharacterized protein n=1 Tax=Vespula squamosa TaxID=30214 RepID=A0ABD2AHF9_VESSQ